VKNIITGVAVYTAVVTATVAWFAFYEFPQASIAQAPRLPAGAPDQADRYAGAIVLPGGAGGCRQVKFDNSTGSLLEAGATACRDYAPGGNSTEGRMNAIRGAFARK